MSEFDPVFGLVRAGDHWHARYWFPKASCVAIRTSHDIPLSRDGDLWVGRLDGPVERYRVIVDGVPRPDPFARWLPDGVSGDPAPAVLPPLRPPKIRRPRSELVILEVHVGTATPEGIFRALIDQLPRYRDLGITALELLPVQQFGGDWGWGYDGVFWFAPHHAYGSPMELAQLIDAAHQLELSVFNDVVYNHLGPVGDPWWDTEFCRSDGQTDWGPTPDLRRPVVRDIIVASVREWLEVYRFDGLRLDAVHCLRDDETPHLLTEIAQVADGTLILENDANESNWLRQEGGYDSQWNDDFHNALHVAVTGERDHYYRDFVDSPLVHLGRCLTEGFAYQGEHSAHRDRNRGSDTVGLSPFAFVNFAQNHDQVGNRGHGDRLIVSHGEDAYWLMATVAWLAPGIPMLWMGEDTGTRNPFPFFGNYPAELARAVREGRLRGHAGLPGFDRSMPDPAAQETFLSAKLPGGAESAEHASRVRELLTIRREALAPRWAQMDVLAGGFEVDDSVLRVRWPVNVELLINLSSAPVTAPAGTLIACSQRGASPWVPPMTARFTEVP